MQKYMPLVKQNVMKFEVFVLGGQRTIEEEDEEHLHLPLLVSSRCVSSEFPTRLCSKALQQ